MPKIILFSQPIGILEKIEKYLFRFPKINFGYMPSDGSSPENAQYLPIWEELCTRNNANLVQIDNSTGTDATKIFDCDTLMICGGNTFQLLHNLKAHGYDKEIKRFVEKKDAVISGFSAGALVLTPTIEIVNKDWDFGPDENLVKLTDLNALAIVNFEVVPHYNPDKDSELLKRYAQSKTNQVYPITNEQFLIVDSATKQVKLIN